MELFEKQKFFNELSFFTLCNAAPTLGKFFDDVVTISSPRTEIMTYESFSNGYTDYIHASINFNDGVVGSTHVFWKEEEAKKLAKYAVSKKIKEKIDSENWNEYTKNAIEEIVNMLGGNMTEILTVVYGKGVEIDVPELLFNHEHHLFNQDEKIVVNTFTIYLGEFGTVKMIEVAKKSYYEDLIEQLKSRI